MVKIFSAILVFSLAFSSSAYAQKKTAKKKRARPATQMSQTQAPPVKRAPSSFSQYGINFSFWQETISAKKGNAETDIRTFFQGLNFRYSYNVPLSSRWRNPYYMDLGLGFVKGKGTAATIQDELKSQPWMSASFTPAIIYRTTEVSDFGFGLPLTYRLIQWKLNEDSGLEMDKKSSFSAGISMIHMNRFTNAAFLTLAITHQLNWNTTIWSLGLDFRF